MDTKKRYVHFITDAVLQDDVNPRKMRRHLKALQKTNPIEAPLPAEEALEDWYKQQNIPHTRSSAHKNHRRIWTCGFSVAVAALLILFLVYPSMEKSTWSPQDNMVGSTDGAMEEGITEETVAEDTVESSEAEAAAPEKSELTEEEPAEDPTEGSGNSEEVHDQESLKDKTDMKDDLWMQIQKQYESHEPLSFTAVAAEVQDQPGCLILESGIRIELAETLNAAAYAGCRLQIDCEADLYHTAEEALIRIENADALQLTVLE